MSDLFVPGPGVVFSADIAVPEHEREVRFYSRVLSTGDSPLWREDLMNNLGMPIIGLGERIPEYSGLPLQWMPHIQVPDVTESVERATELGGTELIRDDEGGQWAVVLDPNGAAFGLIPVVSAEAMEQSGAAAATGPAGRIGWVDITVNNAPAMRDFYRDVIGWSVEDVAMKDGEARYADYNMIGSNGTPLAGVCHARGTNTGLPPIWMIYLPVNDLAESARRVEQEGGTVIKSMRGREDELMYVAVRDPVGAHFALVQG